MLKEKEQKKEEQKNKQDSQNNQQEQGQGEPQNQPPQPPEKQQNQQDNEQQNQSQQNDQQQDGQETDDKEQSEQGQERQQQGNPQNNGEGDGSENNEDENEQIGHDNHQIWKKVVEEAEKEQQRQQQQQNGEGKSLLDKIKDLLSKKEKQNENTPPQSSRQSSEEGGEEQQRQKGNESNFEQSFSAENEKERQHQIEQIRRSLERQKNETMKALSEGNGCSYGDLGNAKSVLDWKKMLKKSVEEEEDRWSYRRSGADNDYMARVEELEDENKSETEVMLDVSGSVNEEMLKEFLRQLKPILKSSKLKVGCFDHRVFDFKEIKNNKDIDNFVIGGGGGTNIDRAVRAFSKKKEVNKIVFTDGYSDSMPRDDLKKTNVIWLIYDNDNFQPNCGKVIYVDKSQFRQNYLNPADFRRGGR